MRRAILSVVLLVAVAGGGFLGYRWWTEGRFVESTDNAYVHADITVVSPRVAGYVRDVRAVDNASVRAGDVLMTIDDRDFAARVREAEAALAAQRAAVATAESQRALQEPTIARAAAALTSADAEKRRADSELARTRSLARDDYASRQRLDTAQADQAKADAGVAQAQATLEAERSRTAVLDAQVAQARAAVDQAAAVLATARIDLENTVVRAPVDGIVGNRAVQTGQYVRPGQQALSVVPLDRVYVVANFKETQIRGLKPGQTAEIEVDAYGTRVTGTIESLSPASGAQFSLLPPENATGNFTKVVQRVPVRVAVPADGPLAGRMRPGLSVVVSVDTRAPGQGGMIAAAAAERR